MSNEPNPPALEMRGVDIVCLRRPEVAVVRNVDWTVAAGDFWVVAGPQHSGKTDLLMVAAGLTFPANGTCQLFGRDNGERGDPEHTNRLRVGFVFQGGQLFNQLTVAQNIALALRYHKILTDAELSQEVMTLLEWTELLPLAEASPLTLAVNWRQRVALARALALRPELLLLDNPLTGLGVRHLQWWLRILEQLSRGHEPLGGRPMTIVATTDDLRPWPKVGRQFALLHEEKFTLLGGWREVECAEHEIVKELRAVEMGP
jgi:ABC-type sulfate/molybdate transport systems ATPase subunit